MTALHFPDDIDGESLRRLHAKGDRLEATRWMHLFLVFQRRQEAEKICALVEAEGAEAGVIHPRRKGDRWTAEVCIRIVPTYENLVALKGDLHRLAMPLGGKHADWGTYVILPEDT